MEEFDVASYDGVGYQGHSFAHLPPKQQRVSFIGTAVFVVLTLLAFAVPIAVAIQRAI